jgi:hypothetical protein
MTPCSLVGGYECLGGTHRFVFTLTIKRTQNNSVDPVAARSEARALSARTLDRRFESRSRHGYLSLSVYVVGLEVLAAVSTKMAVIWVVAPCSLVEVYQRFRGPCCLHHQGALMMQAAKTSETLVNFYQTSRCYNPEDSHRCIYCVVLCR